MPKGKKGFQKGHGFWKGKKRLNMMCENNPTWKGDKVGYLALHAWIYRRLGTPKFCVECKSISATRYDWANISGKYFRDVSDYRRLCRKCHKKFDLHLLARGEGQGCAKLNNKKVIKIRKIYKTGKYSQREISEMFKVSKFTIYAVISRKSWKHI